MQRIKAGIVGAGNISGIYIKNLLSMFSDTVELSAIASNTAEKAKEAAEKNGIEFIKSANDLFARSDIGMIINLTPPAEHFNIAKAALDAGKHIYNEKPLCANLLDAETLVETAQKNNLRIGCAPDTFLGAGIETARKLLDDGWIGRPVAGSAFLMNHGPEHWHPSPEFFYAPGGGPLFDMGPYYLTALVSLLGPVASVSGSSKISFAQRTITSETKYGKMIDAVTPTHISALLDFKNGASVSMIMSFDVWAHSLPHIEIYGSEGTMQIGDPNFFISPVRIKRYRSEKWQDIPLFNASGEKYAGWLNCDNWRGIGVAGMAQAITQGTPHRASGSLALHVLEIMTRILESGEKNRRVKIRYQCKRP